MKEYLTPKSWILDTPSIPGIFEPHKRLSHLGELGDLNQSTQVIGWLLDECLVESTRVHVLGYLQMWGKLHFNCDCEWTLVMGEIVIQVLFYIIKGFVPSHLH
mgnify:CR=1 FL=1